jgi:hypothetical protein
MMMFHEQDFGRENSCRGVDVYYIDQENNDLMAC